MLLYLGKDGWSIGSWPVGSRCRDNNWSWAVGPHWSWGIGGGWSIDWLTGVLNIGNVTGIGIRCVGDSLEATIRKSNVVFSLGGIAIAGL